MRTSEFRERLGIDSSNTTWYRNLLDSHCLKTSRCTGSTPKSPKTHYTIDWNDRDANWFIRLWKRKHYRGAWWLPSIAIWYGYARLPYNLALRLRSYRDTSPTDDDAWRDQVHATAIRMRTYQIMLNTLLKDAAKAGHEPLDSWTDTSYYDKRERENIVSNTRRWEPGQ